MLDKIRAISAETMCKISRKFRSYILDKTRAMSDDLEKNYYFVADFFPTYAGLVNI